MIDPFIIIEPKEKKVPFILSVPHCGIEFPDEIRANYKESMSKHPDDTDWFVHNLYDFASEYGITIIHAKYSRWVIDLNRDPESKPLYNDGRIITGLTPTTDFFGNDIYVSEDKIPDQIEVKRRLEMYYWPYYRKLQELLDERKNEFGNVLLWDAHSIRQFVPTIQKEPFPDMILGDNDGKTADPRVIETALSNLQAGQYTISHNSPFKGGHITRYFGKPENNVHALQLEMNKILYMNDKEVELSFDRMLRVRSLLKPTFESLIQVMADLKKN